MLNRLRKLTGRWGKESSIGRREEKLGVEKLLQGEPHPSRKAGQSEAGLTAAQGYMLPLTQVVIVFLLPFQPKGLGSVSGRDGAVVRASRPGRR